MNNDVYNLQPYGYDGDTTGFRKINYYSQFKSTLEIFIKKENKILDLGSGNGRFSTLLKNINSNIYGIDPIMNLDDRFVSNYSDFQKKNIEEEDRLFDVVLSVGSLNAIFNQFNVEKTFQLINKILIEKGLLIIFIEAKDKRIDFFKNYYILEHESLSSDELTKLLIFKKK